MMDKVVTFKELQEIYKRKTPISIIQKLRTDGIKYQTNMAGEPFTTMTALNLSMGIKVNTIVPESPMHQEVVVK